jgi:hypothetical protein
MTAVGTRKLDRKGRSTGRLYTKASQKIAGQFIAHRVEMLRSPAWRALNFAARRVLDRLEIEHAEHGARENGSLVCTYDDFKRWGIRRGSVSAALADLIALGFLEVTQQGRMAAADFYIPSKYRITYLNTRAAGPTDEWGKIATDEEAETKVAKVAQTNAGRSLATALPVGALRSRPGPECASSRDIESRPVSVPGTVGSFLCPEHVEHRRIIEPGIGTFLSPGLRSVGARNG